MRRIACNRAAAVALKRRLGEAPNGQPAASRPRLSSPPCPGLNLPPGWHRDGWVAPTVPDEPLDFRTGPVPEAALAYACLPRNVASPDKSHQQQIRAKEQRHTFGPCRSPHRDCAINMYTVTYPDEELGGRMLGNSLPLLFGTRRRSAAFSASFTRTLGT